MILIKQLKSKKINGITRRLGLFKCSRCGLEKISRTDTKQTSDLCSRCNKIKHGMEGSKVYSLWLNIKSRCYNHKNNRYKNYGARGITVCNEWLNSSNFIKWALDNGYKETKERNTEYTIERMDVNKGYNPDNCVFIPLSKQHYNKKLKINPKTGFYGVHKHQNSYVTVVTYKNKIVYKNSCKTALEAACYRDTYIINNDLPHIINNIPESTRLSVVGVI